MSDETPEGTALTPDELEAAGYPRNFHELDGPAKRKIIDNMNAAHAAAEDGAAPPASAESIPGVSLTGKTAKEKKPDKKAADDVEVSEFEQLTPVREDDQFQYFIVPDDVTSYQEWADRFGGHFRSIANLNGVTNEVFNLEPGQEIRVERGIPESLRDRIAENAAAKKK